MPESRKRKKKVKKKGPKVDKEKIVLGGMEAVRKGKHIFLRNKMTDAQHVQWIEQIRENRPKVYEDIRGMIGEVADLINGYDKILLVGSMAGFYYQRILTDEDDDGKSDVNLEYLQSIALAAGNGNVGKVPEPEILVRINELLETIRRHLSAYYATEHVTGRYSEVQNMLRFHMITELLFIRGIGYWSHVRELYKEMFTLHDPVFLKYYGFSSWDIVEAFDRMEASFECRMLLPNGAAHPNREIKLMRWTRANPGKFTPETFETGEFLNDFANDYPEACVENNAFVEYPLNIIDTAGELFRIRQLNDVHTRVAKAVSMKFGDNAGFAQPEKFKYDPMNETAILAKPVVEDDKGNLYLFNMSLPSRNLFAIAMDLLALADKKYYDQSFQGNRVQIAKDNFIEAKVLALFQKMLPDVQFFRGVHYKYMEPGLDMKCFKASDGKYELDILGVGPHATYLIEVKAGLVSPKAKRGAIEYIQKDLSDIVGDAICQSYRAYRYIAGDPGAEFEVAGGAKVKPINTKRVFRISVSFSYVGTLLAELSRLQQAGIFDQVADYAWTVNIFDLMPVAELVPTEAFFIDYLEKRLVLYKDERLVNVDEMDMLGLYYENDLKLDKEMKHVKTLQLNQFSRPINAYFEKRGPKPVKKG